MPRLVQAPALINLSTANLLWFVCFFMVWFTNKYSWFVLPTANYVQESITPSLLSTHWSSCLDWCSFIFWKKLKLLVHCAIETDLSKWAIWIVLRRKPGQGELWKKIRGIFGTWWENIISSIKYPLQYLSGADG